MMHEGTGYKKVELKLHGGTGATAKNGEKTLKWNDSFQNTQDMCLQHLGVCNMGAPLEFVYNDNKGYSIYSH